MRRRIYQVGAVIKEPEHMETELPDSMPAVVAHGPGDYRLEELPVPKPGPGEVVIKVKSAGICASDIKCYTGAPMFWGDERRAGYCQPPVTPGHEFVGEVVALGEDAGELYNLSSEITPSASRSCLAGNAGIASAASIGCARSTTFMAFASARSGPGRSTCFFPSGL